MGAKKVGDLVNEIAAASKEQSQGIDQINRTINEMDKVVQKNAASAEESASASEELNAQAEQMKAFVSELSAMVGGQGSGNGAVALSNLLPGGKTHKSLPQKSLPSSPRAKTGKTAMPPAKGRALDPESVIPLEDGNFQDF
jgi:methyl-accepting chemotaxis protein